MKLLLVGDSPLAHTGTAKVMRYVGLGLAERGWEVGFAGFGYNGCPHDFPHPIWPWSRDVNCPAAEQERLFRQAIDGYQPDIVLCFGDAWVYEYGYRQRMQLDAMGRRTHFVAWLTVDCAPFPLGCRQARTLDWCDVLLATTRFGADLMRGAILSDFGTEVPIRYDARPVTLGVDPEIYNREGPPSGNESREGVRRNIPDDRAVIAWVGANNGRKQPGTALETLSILKRRGRAVTMWLRMPTNPWDVINLPEVCSQLGLSLTTDLQQRCEHDVFWLNATPGTPAHLSEQNMAVLYRRADVFLSTASAGAPELPILEARACGTPAVAPNTSCFAEVADVLAAPLDGAVWAQPNVRHQLPSGVNMAAAVELVLDNPIEPGPVRSWSEVVDELDEILREPMPDWLGQIVL